MFGRHALKKVSHCDPNVERSKIQQKKSRIRETKHLSTDADSSTDAIGGDRFG